MKKTTFISFFILFCCFAFGQNTIRLDQLDVINTSTVGWGQIKKNRSIDGNPLMIKNQVYSNGVGTHANSRINIKLNKTTKKFTCVLGIDDEVYKPNEGIASYEIINYSNGTETIVKSGIIKRTDSNAVIIDLDVTNWEYISLVCKEYNGNNWGDHVDWCNAEFTYISDGDKVPTAITYNNMLNDEVTSKIRLDQLDVINTGTVGWGQMKTNKSIDGNPLKLKGQIYNNGVGTHANSRINIKLNKTTKKFTCVLGIDDEVYKPNEGIASYEIINYSNGTETIVKSGIIKRTDSNAVIIDLDVTNWEYISLVCKEYNGNNWGDHVDWCDAEFTYISDGDKVPTASTYDNMLNDEVTSKIRLDQLDVINTGTVGWGQMKTNKSIDGNPLKLKGQIYNNGVGTHTESRINVKLHKTTTRFTGVVGIDDEVSGPQIGIAKYEIINYSNGTETIVKSGIIKRTDSNAVIIDLDVTNWEYISLVCKEYNGNNWGDHVDWCDAEFTYSSNGDNVPFAVTYEDLLNGSDTGTVNIAMQGISKHYSLPNTKMMHKYRTDNSQDIITVSDLPNGLTYNSQRQLVEGIIVNEGTYQYKLNITRNGATDSKNITVVVSSDLISPTPLMGWMSWNIFQENINETNIKQVSDLLISTGLKDVGFNYVLIDDVWHSSSRKPDGKPMYDTNKFPSGFNYLTNYIHNKDLKVGIYSDAAEFTCVGEYGSLNYETIDAQQYADWGFDFLKYDFCHAPSDVEVAKERYKTMKDALDATGKNFYFNICEWGDLEPWKWAAKAGGNAWRVTWDSRDAWDHGGTYGVENCGVTQAIDVLKNLNCYAGPNQFNDADMMCVGLYGSGIPSSHNGANGMTDTEYQTQFSMWSMFSSPLMISFDLSTMNQATKTILTNEEVIAVNQDLMGQQAELIYSQNGKEVYLKDLENGDIAVALLNRNSSTTTISVPVQDLFIDSDSINQIRDLWLHQEVEMANKNYISAVVKPHEAKVYRIKLNKNTLETMLVINRENFKKECNKTVTLR